MKRILSILFPLILIGCGSNQATASANDARANYGLGDHNYVGAADGLEVYAETAGSVVVSVVGGSWAEGDTCEFSVGDQWSQNQKTMLSPMDGVCRARFDAADIKPLCHSDHYPYVFVGETIVPLELICELL